ncbi:MAG: hypothetical protein LQ346_006495, partial [Caloplaca aetnensis]
RFTFRAPTPADLRGSQARAQHLLPRWEVPPPHYSAQPGEEDRRVIRAEDVRGLRAGQAESARGHWKVMRSVLPDEAWENW